MIEKPYVTGIALSQWAYGAERLGLPAFEIMEKCQLDAAYLGDLSSKIPLATFESYILELILASGDEMFGFHIGQQIMPALYGSLSMLMMTAESLEAGVRLAVHYAPIAAGNSGGLELREDKDDQLLIGLLAHRNTLVRRHWIEASTTLIVKAIRFNFPSFAPDILFFEHAKPSQFVGDTLLEFFRCPIQFGAGFNGAKFASEKLGEYVNHYGKHSLEMAKELADKQLDAQKGQKSFTDKVKMQIRDLVGTTSPRREIVAERLGVSARTLDRRLSDAGYSWQGLVDGIRSQIAYDCLARSDEKIVDIAHKLGFSDVRAFQRRFRSWSGMTPTEYRRSVKKGNTP